MATAFPIPPSVELAGRIVRGHGVASGQAADSPYPAGTIAMQAPVFRVLGLDLAPYHPATLNVSVAPKRVEIVAPSHRFEQVRWTDLHPPETFSFAPCRLVVDGATYDALLYHPHPETKARHAQRADVVEVLAPYIDGIAYGQAVALRVSTKHVRVIG